ncbi:hypothetical protein ACHHYP_03997 [Achlya hypogyna]|uniref:BZIP domain-containing protein n=1 Tax=Achlya hypogyna TaxID=1202772 RepID=A0A1V9ZPH8_ACHHY|nr:hypothetical protein ACHHYP_03997 [Achlya hypogyna]
MKETEKRRRNREQVRKHRHLNALEKKGLESYVSRLQATLDELVVWRDARQPLSWRNVAHALQIESTTVTNTNSLLQAELRHRELVAQALWRPRPITTTTTWRQASLLGTTPSARQLGLSWLLQHMQHNIPRAFDEAFAWDDIGPSLRLNMTRLRDHGAHIVVHKQRLDPFPMEDVFRFFQHQHDSQTVLERHGDDLQLVQFNYGAATQNIAIQYIVEDHRVLILSRGIEHDDLRPLHALKRTWMDWIVLERHGSGATMVREVYETTSWYSGDNDFVPMTTTSPWYQRAARSLLPAASSDAVFDKYKRIYQQYLDQAYPEVEIAECRQWCRQHH